MKNTSSEALLKDTTEQQPKFIVCNGANPPKTKKQNSLVLDYRDVNNRNVSLKLQNFVQQAYHLPDRILDLLELAGYIFAADRLCFRGARDSVEYQTWARKMQFIVKVRDFNFWNDPRVKNKLAEALIFMTGDKEYKFCFEPGHSTPPTSLFDYQGFDLPDDGKVNVMLFSGGLDSLAGAVDLLQNTQDVICLVSHQSQPDTIKTQNTLVRCLTNSYPDRIRHYKFKCTLVSDLNSAVEETQRTRAFLYNSIAFAIASSRKKSRHLVHENGVTSINFARRQDGINARTSRTTHPKTVSLLQELFSLIEEKKFSIHMPFLFKTKTDVFTSFKDSKLEGLIPNAVSCSKTYLGRKQASHCGECFQCVDRRIASFASELDGVDTVYYHNLIQDTNKGEGKTCLFDYILQAREFAESTLGSFFHDNLNELTHLAEPASQLFPKMEEPEAITQLWELCHRHGLEVHKALKRIQGLYDEPFQKRTKDSLLSIIAEQVYLKRPVERLIDSICDRLSRAIPASFQHNQPVNEQDLNDKIESFIKADGDDYEREFPGLRFALATAVPDHSFSEQDLLIETKYLRGKTSPNKITEAMAADVTKYSNGSYMVLFVVYDPFKAIKDDKKFCSEFGKFEKCSVKLFR